MIQSVTKALYTIIAMYTLSRKAWTQTKKYEYRLYKVGVYDKDRNFKAHISKLNIYMYARGTSEQPRKSSAEKMYAKSNQKVYRQSMA